ncbi:hypothetical protein PHET_05395 [Paragonimus heterotremus]|uniref:Uncharacterized protein n=1 Tax=Paragonimus heterotremus TaxID=100268 RepID=A0A8J4WRM3_9TREM|nr:hypothetical protein PHET_05395 [Paragonimus heterotremus]
MRNDRFDIFTPDKPFCFITALLRFDLSSDLITQLLRSAERQKRDKQRTKLLRLLCRQPNDAEAVLNTVLDCIDETLIFTHQRSRSCARPVVSTVSGTHRRGANQLKRTEKMRGLFSSAKGMVDDLHKQQSTVTNRNSNIEVNLHEESDALYLWSQTLPTEV